MSQLTGVLPGAFSAVISSPWLWGQVDDSFQSNLAPLGTLVGRQESLGFQYQVKVAASQWNWYSQDEKLVLTALRNLNSAQFARSSFLGLYLARQATRHHSARIRGMMWGSSDPFGNQEETPCIHFSHHQRLIWLLAPTCWYSGSPTSPCFHYGWHAPLSPCAHRWVYSLLDHALSLSYQMTATQESRGLWPLPRANPLLDVLGPTMWSELHLVSANWW